MCHEYHLAKLNFTFLSIKKLLLWPMLELQSLRSAVCHAVEKNCQWISHSWGAPPLHHDFCPFQIQYEQNSGIITSGVAQRYYVNIASEITIPLRRSTQPIGAAPCEKGGQGGSELSGSTAAFGNPQICFGCSLVIPHGPRKCLANPWDPLLELLRRTITVWFFSPHDIPIIIGLLARRLIRCIPFR